MRNPIDVTLVFGVPFLYFTVQEVLLISTQYGLAICAGALTLFYSILAYTLFKSKNTIVSVLAETFFALALIFLTLFIPYAFNVHFTITSWELEATLLIWLGIKQSRIFVQLLGIVMLCISSLLLLENMLNSSSSNFITFNLFFTALASFTSSYLLYKFYQFINKNPSEIHTLISWLFFGWALLAWSLASIYFINQHLQQYVVASYLIYFSFSSIMAWYLQKWLAWAWLRIPAFLILGVISLLFIHIIQTTANPLGHYAWLGWLITFFTLYCLLHQHEKNPEDYLIFLHIFSILLLDFLLILAGHYYIKYIAHLNSDYQAISILLPSVIMLFGSLRLQKLNLWPVNRDQHTYSLYINGIFAAGIAYLLIITNFTQAGDLTPLSYFPLFNILDITLLLGLIAITLWLQHLLQANQLMQSYNKFLLVVLSFEYFIWLNSVLARSLHHWLSIPYNFYNLFNSIIVQATYSVCWGLIALVCFLFAKYRLARWLWLIGAWLIGLVVLKLFTIDLAHSNTLERIISFVIVGLIMLLIGYFSPIPPRVKQ